MDTVNDPQKAKLHMLKAQAVRQALVEVMQESREEIIKRAKAKLIALGIEVKDEDLNAQI